MKRHRVLIVAVFALLGLGLALGVTGATAAQGPHAASTAAQQASVGRYQAVSHGSYLWLLDTSTGQAWRAIPAQDKSEPARWVPTIEPKP